MPNPDVAMTQIEALERVVRRCVGLKEMADSTMDAAMLALAIIRQQSPASPGQTVSSAADVLGAEKPIIKPATFGSPPEGE